MTWKILTALNQIYLESLPWNGNLNWKKKKKNIFKHFKNCLFIPSAVTLNTCLLDTFAEIWVLLSNTLEENKKGNILSQIETVFGERKYGCS